MQVPRIDCYLGINTYATNVRGIGGTIKNFADDFLVQEVLVDGSIAKISQKPSNQVLLSSQKKQPFLLCIFTKRNWDFFSALKNISRQLGIIETKIGFAGIKDAKAITSQFITLDHFLKEEIKSLRLKDISLYPLGYFREHLSAYYLLGNKFTITIRQLEQPISEIEKSINKIIGELDKIGGLPNYFGYQRFGTVRPITHLVGKAIIKDNFKKAIMLFLTDYSDSEHPSSRQARKDLHENQDFERSLKEFPKHLRFERVILGHLVKKSNDYIGAFKRLPIRLQLLFVQAYQSYLFNLFLSERLKIDESWRKAVIGDFVVNIERSGLPMTQTGKLVEVQNLKEINKLIELGKMRIALPLIGTKQKFSSGLSGQIQEKVFEKEGIKPEAFYIKKIPRISSKGRLRTIFTPLKDFKIIQSKKTENKLNLNVMLLRGSYATIFLREIMKPVNPIEAGF